MNWGRGVVAGACVLALVAFGFWPPIDSVERALTVGAVLALVVFWFAMSHRDVERDVPDNNS